MRMLLLGIVFLKGKVNLLVENSHYQQQILRNDSVKVVVEFNSSDQAKKIADVDEQEV